LANRTIVLSSPDVQFHIIHRILNKMKRIFFLAALIVPVFLTAQQMDYPIKAVDFTKVKLVDNFWLPRIKTNHEVTIPASFERCDKTGRIKNFQMAAAKSGKFCTIYPFDDTDLYKTIEGASYSLSLFHDPALRAYLDSLIDIIGKAQEPDGYLYTARTINPNDVHPWAGKERWERERELSHELYNSGHLYEAAAAHFLATGEKNLLNIALKNADLVCSVFGPAPEQKKVAPGHEVVEMGLVKLYRITGNQKYLQTAKFFVEQRGHYGGYDPKSKDPWKNGSYWQDDKPVTQQQEAEGHAVRAGYLYSAVADVAALTGDTAFLNAIDRIWENEVSKKIYVQGGVGAKGDGERFGEDYELPNATAYNETCAAIANVYFNHRMFMLHGESKYIDVLEKSLYNGLISGVGMDGKSFFYTNAMEIKNSYSHRDMEAERSGWFPCSCCPTNVARLIPSVPGYVYAQKDNDVYVNLFISSDANLVVNKKNLQIVQKNNYPWEGDLQFTVSPQNALPFNLLIRIPGWSANEAIPSDLYQFATASNSKVEVKINGQAVGYTLKNGYAVLSRTWKKGDQVEVFLPMEVRRVVANNNIKDDRGKVALQKGPIIYCAEWADNNGRAANLIVPSNAVFQTEFRKDLLNGVMVLKTEVPTVVVNNDANTITTETRTMTAIPYYSWAHRGKGEMVVWFPTKVVDVELISNE
jgi:DUF1680 family protein